MKKYLLALLILCALSGALLSQTIKLGIVNTDRVLFESNEAAEIARLYNLDRQNWTNQVRQLDEEIKQMERQFEIDKLTRNEAAKREAQSRIDQKKSEAGRLLEEYFGEGGRAETRYRELIDPLTKKIHDVIRKIADDERYTMVFDVSMGTVLYALPTLDITDQVLQELNKGTVRPAEEQKPTHSFDTPGQPGDGKENPFVEPEIKK